MNIHFAIENEKNAVFDLFKQLKGDKVFDNH